MINDNLPHSIEVSIDKITNISLDLLNGELSIIEKNNSSKEVSLNLNISEKEKKILNLINNLSDLSPVGCTILLSYACNFGCNYCFQGKVNRNSPIITKDQVEKAFEIMENSTYPRFNKINLFGGEPLLPRNLKIIEYILQRCPSNWPIAITTNGSNLKTFVDVFKKYRNRIDIQITIDGIKAIHDSKRPFKNGSGSFDTIINNIDFILDNTDARVIIRSNIDKRTISYLKDLRNFFKTKNYYEKHKISFYYAPIDYESVVLDDSMKSEYVIKGELNFYLKLLEELDVSGILYDEKWKSNIWTINILEEVLGNLEMPLPKSSYCSAQRGGIVFDPYGDIYSCWQEAGDKKLKIGEYYPQYKLNKYYQTWIDRTSDKTPGCRDCSLKFICGGECGFFAQKKYGTIVAPSCEGKEIEFEKLKLTIPYIWKKMKKVRNKE